MSSSRGPSIRPLGRLRLLGAHARPGPDPHRRPVRADRRLPCLTCADRMATDLRRVKPLTRGRVAGASNGWGGPAGEPARLPDAAGSWNRVGVRHPVRCGKVSG